eukprot:scaffold172293_cov55-Attheya_sp.AAC.1
MAMNGDGKADGWSTAVPVRLSSLPPHGCVLTPRATCPGQAGSVPFQNEEQQPVQLKNTIALVCFFSQRQQNDGWRCAVLIPT